MKNYIYPFILFASLSGNLFAENAKEATLWISTKTQFGYNTTFIRFPSLETCQAELNSRTKILSPNTEIWCR
jgi:hypothetical protein